ncbi:MAG: hypothetical protein ACRCTY_09430 [Candidatus Adiutrix sp.]
MKDILNIEERQLSDLLPMGFDPHQSLHILTEYLRNLETVFEEVKKNATAERRHLESERRTLNKTNDEQKQEIERLTSDLMDLTNTLEENESLLSTAHQKIATYEKQLKKFHREQSDLGAKLTQKENDANYFQQEMISIKEAFEQQTASLNTANNKLDEYSRKLAAERDAATTHEKESRRLTLDLSESQGKTAIVERKLEEVVVKYSQEISRLNERLAVDSQHEVMVIKKRLKSSLTPEMRDFEKLATEKLSIETASNFKALIERFIAKMEQAGVALK